MVVPLVKNVYVVLRVVADITTMEVVVAQLLVLG
jgi:hypothetical protein